MIERLEGTFFGYKDVELFYQVWRSTSFVEEKQTPVGTIVVTHGLAEHSDNYDRLCSQLSSEGWLTVAWDLRGHGRSEGKRGYVENFTDFSHDLDLFIRFLKSQLHKRGEPLVLFGHSLGGLIILQTMMLFAPNHVSALCLSSPALGVSLPVPALKIKAAHWLAQWAPKLTLHNEIQFKDLHKDEWLLKKYAEDPLRHEKISSRLFLGMQEAIESVFRQAPDLHIPLLMQLAGDERLVSTEASQKFFNQVGSKKKEIYVYEDSLHEIFNDLDRERVFADLKSFLHRHVLQSLSTERVP